MSGSTGSKRGKKKSREVGMQLMTEELRKKLPALGSQDGLGGKAIAYVKYFTPDAGWTFYATEFDGRDTFFGLVDGSDLRVMRVTSSILTSPEMLVTYEKPRT